MRELIRTLPSRHTTLPSPRHTTLILLTVLTQFLLLTPPATAAPVVATPTIVPFSDWAPATCPTPTGEDPAPTKRLVVHHTHEPVAHTPDEVLPALAEACSAHVDRGFSTIGYHYIVDPWGTIYQGRGGMPLGDGSAPTTQAQGAHVAGTNGGAVGVVFLGDHENRPPTAASLEVATQLMAWLLEPTGQDPSARVGVESSGVGSARHAGHMDLDIVAGHSASNNTKCPGKHLRALLPEISDRMRQTLAGETPTGWTGLAVDTVGTPNGDPAPASAGVLPAPAKGKGQGAQNGKGQGADKAKGQGAPVGKERDVPDAIGPVASAGEVVARDLRENGLGSLAERVSARP